MKISLIVAMSQDRVIGKNNALPWDLPEDRRFFELSTKGKPVVMGRKTFESLKKSLQGRINIILTHQRNYDAKDSIVMHSVEEALNAASGSDEIMIIGGAEIYKEFLPLADKMYITMIHNAFGGDTLFPEFDRNEWRETILLSRPADQYNPHAFTVSVFFRKNKSS